MQVKKIVLGIGILVVYALALWQGMEAFYPTPQWDDFCQEGFPRAPFVKEAECDFPSELAEKEGACSKAKGYFRYEYDENGCVVDGVCDECSIEYEDALDAHSKNVFIFSLIAGVVTFVIGFSILSIEPVGSALLASGVWAVFWGTVANWRNFGQITRFIILIVVLIALIWIAVKFAKKKG